MKKFTYSAAAVALATTSFSPVFAAPVAFSSLPAAQQVLVQTACNGKLPSINSPFTATPIELDAAVQLGLETGRKTLLDEPGGVELSRTPFSFDLASEHRNGQSPNIFGFYTSMITYSGGHSIVEITTVDRYHVTFGCLITKPNGEIAPNGLNKNDGTLFVNYDLNKKTVTDDVSNPNVTLPFTEDRVICISPSLTSKKTAASGWANQNLYNGECSTARYLEVGMGAGTHSNSVPNLAPLRPNTDHDEALPLDSLFTTPMEWDGVEGLD